MLLKNLNTTNENINLGNAFDEKKEKEEKDRIFLEIYSPYANVENTNHIKEDEENQILCDYFLFFGCF